MFYKKITHASKKLDYILMHLQNYDVQLSPVHQLLLALIKLHFQVLPST